MVFELGEGGVVWEGNIVRFGDRSCSRSSRVSGDGRIRIEFSFGSRECFTYEKVGITKSSERSPK